MKNFYSLLFVSLISVVAQADLLHDYEAIKNNGRNLQDTGAICEEVAKLDKQREYGDQYTVLSGVEYSGRDGTIGELDIVVFENRTNEAVLIGEVKCWNDMSQGLRKARDQRKRFLDNINSRRELHFRWKDDPKVRLTKQMFNKTDVFISIAQKGAKKQGYENELQYTLRELMELRDMIMGCQASKACKPALH